jgi:hypothetical protein
MHFKRLLFCVAIMVASTMASASSKVVVFRESGFPSADCATAPDAFLQHALPDAQFASSAELKERLGSAQLLVLSYGSAFPEEAWPQIQSFLQRGGNLLVLGGRPFTRARTAMGQAGSCAITVFVTRDR